MPGEDDELRDLMIQYQGGSHAAFEELYSRLVPSLRRYLMYLGYGVQTADDLLQETFLHIHRCRAAYNPGFAVRPWVFGLARNVFLMNRRAAGRFGQVHQAREDLDEFAASPKADGFGEQDEIRKGLAQIPPDQAEALLLHHWIGFSFEEISGLLGINSAAARARASRGMTALRAAMNAFRKAHV